MPRIYIKKTDRQHSGWVQKLTFEDRAEIVKSYLAEEFISDIAKKYNVCHTTIIAHLMRAGVYVSNRDKGRQRPRGKTVEELKISVPQEPVWKDDAYEKYLATKKSPK